MCWKSQISQLNSKRQTCLCFSLGTKVPVLTSSGWMIPMPWPCLAALTLVRSSCCYESYNLIKLNLTAAEVLTMGHPFVKLKPLAAATLESRLKAKKAGATSLQPYRQRPETCTALARRLVSGALGVKLPTAPEERENERRVLREAKGKYLN